MKHLFCLALCVVSCNLLLVSGSPAPVSAIATASANATAITATLGANTGGTGSNGGGSTASSNSGASSNSSSSGGTGGGSTSSGSTAPCVGCAPTINCGTCNCNCSNGGGQTSDVFGLGEISDAISQYLLSLQLGGVVTNATNISAFAVNQTSNSILNNTLPIFDLVGQALLQILNETVSTPLSFATGILSG